ncbi:hypothetical protein [Nostoc sp. PCC 7107]|uniref:hypothetical protein n=1 Tax=Nostoc sp. PCC 7107 TaxID=317936 RepID=UPI0012F97F6C|nr:hypothetical protein [Nostoc sp. PCC 7107]
MSKHNKYGYLLMLAPSLPVDAGLITYSIQVHAKFNRFEEKITRGTRDAAANCKEKSCSHRNTISTGKTDARSISETIQSGQVDAADTADGAIAATTNKQGTAKERNTNTFSKLQTCKQETPTRVTYFTTRQHGDCHSPATTATESQSRVFSRLVFRESNTRLETRSPITNQLRSHSALSTKVERSQFNCR